MCVSVCRLKKVSVEEKKPEKADPMMDMMERIRSGNVQLKKTQENPPPKPQKSGTGDVMSEMAKLLVSENDKIYMFRFMTCTYTSHLMVCRPLVVGRKEHPLTFQEKNSHRAIRCQMNSL